MATEHASKQPALAHRQRKRDWMVQTILDTARAIMREQGVAALSMQELARRLDIRAPSLYNYFSSKMDIYDALFRLGINLFAEQFEKINQTAETWQEYTRLAFEGYFTFAMQNPELYQLCFERPVPGFVPSEESMRLSLAMLHQTYQRTAEFKKGHHIGLPAEQMTDLLISMMHGITALHMANEPDVPLGQGRFGILIPAALKLLEKVWSEPRHSSHNKRKGKR